MIRFLEKCGVVYSERNDFRLGPALVIVFLIVCFVGTSIYILTTSLN